jgi:predicted deacylase
MKSNKKMEILGQSIEPGKGYQLNMNVAKLHTHTPIQVPVFIERSKKDGPVLLIMAGMHGDEINGVEIVRRIIRNKYNKPNSGTVICLPVFNIFGFLNISRVLPDGRDLNRSFPGSKNGSLAGQFAYQFLKEIAPHVDYVLDFHTGARQRNNAAQVRCVLKDPRSVELAKAFNPPFIVHSNLIPKSLRDAMISRGKQILLFEGGKADSIEEGIVHEGVMGVKRILVHLGMRSFKENVLSDRESVILRSDKWMRALNSGLFLSYVTNGQKVRKNEMIGLITDPFGKVERKVKAWEDGYIFCINESPVVNKGDAIFHIGSSEREAYKVVQEG